jgi:hypothetical protein
VLLVIQLCFLHIAPRRFGTVNRGPDRAQSLESQLFVNQRRALKGMVEDLRRDRDAWRAQAESNENP